jgi:hypothetical protein
MNFLTVCRAAIPLLFLPLIFLLISSGDSARADWMNLSGAEAAANIAEITIEQTHVRVNLEIYLGDLETFRDLVPDDWVADATAERPPLEERLRHFASETLKIVTETGDSLPVELHLVEPRLRKDRASPFAGMTNPVTGLPGPKPPEDKRVLYAELVYPFAGQPQTLTFTPPGGGPDASAVNIGFIAYHLAVPIIDFRFLSKSATLTLDWADPWYSRFDNPTLKRHHSSALMSFLYVESDEVRHEVLTRIKDIGTWLPLGLRDEDTMAPDEWPAVKARVAAYLMGKNPVVIDGRTMEPTLVRADFVSLSVAGVQVIEDPQVLDNSTAILGVILRYDIDHLPDKVTVEWELFPDQVERVPVTVTDPVGPFLSFAERDDRVTEWENFLIKYQVPTVEPIALGGDRFLPLPILSILSLLLAVAAVAIAFKPRLMPRAGWLGVAVIGVAAAVGMRTVAVIPIDNPFAGAPGEPAAAEIVTRLAGNLHTALGKRDDTARHEALSVSVAEADLATILPELERALIVIIQGGGLARIDAVDDIVVRDIQELGTKGGFRASAEWSAEARAGHWGHLHRRPVRFATLIDLLPIDGAWKLTGLTVLNVSQ